MTAQPLSGAVLAGGSSLRLQQDKALLRLWGMEGPTLLEMSVARLSPTCDEILVVSDGPKHWPALTGRVIFDRYPRGGALGGIYTALSQATYAFVLVVACDMPFLNQGLLQYMAGLPRDYDVLIPRRPPAKEDPSEAPQVEPLHAIYGRPCLGPMQELLERGARRIVHFFPQVRVRYVEEEEIARFDPAGLAFCNINTPQDLARVQRILSRKVC